MARLADMLLHPGGEYEFDGQHLRYPRYPSGLLGGRQRPSTIIRTLTGSAKRGDGRRRWWCTSSTGPRRAKFSDIVLPVTTSLEREDIGSGGHDGFMIAMSAQIPPVAEARDDYAIFLRSCRPLRLRRALQRRAKRRGVAAAYL
ncbi:Dimethyl sulfoxide/trimethylamine N-oxide reductase precursor [Raoultella terrigena]|uniref:Dimethyl sulfoxide/trimethylamine N-oxide reductase n=1 Tax=Raoultella terrigena TaxID=577 RepID=A0A4U9DEX6_RAOTE|nr:Dimethyl sulfoxide/trimethylamine N-oxide reductase precursor [Raoultella terrigena]